MADLERTQSTPALHTLDLQETRGRQRQNTSAGIHDPSPVSRSRSHSGGSADGLPPGAALVKTQTTAKMHTTLSAPREEDPMRQSSDTEASDAEGRPRAGDAPQTPEQAAPPRRESHCLGPKVEEPRCRSERCCWARRFCCRTSEYSSIEEQLSHGDSAKYRPDIKTCQPLAGLRRKRAELVTVRDLIYHGNAHQIHRLISQVRDGVEHEGHGVQFECSLLNDLLTRKVPNLEALERQPEPYDPDGGSTPLPRSNTYDGKLKNERAAMVVIDETESRGTDLQHTSSSPSRLPPQTDTTGLKGKAHAEVMLQALELSKKDISMDGQAAEAAKDPFFTEDDAPRRELTDADKQRLLPGVITLSLINKELEEVEATLLWREEIKTKTLFGVLGGILVLFNSWLTTSNLQTLDTTLRELLGESSQSEFLA